MVIAPAAPTHLQVHMCMWACVCVHLGRRTWPGAYGHARNGHAHNGHAHNGHNGHAHVWSRAHACMRTKYSTWTTTGEPEATWPLRSAPSASHDPADGGCTLGGMAAGAMAARAPAAIPATWSGCAGMGSIGRVAMVMRRSRRLSASHSSPASKGTS